MHPLGMRQVAGAVRGRLPLRHAGMLRPAPTRQCESSALQGRTVTSKGAGRWEVGGAPTNDRRAKTGARAARIGASRAHRLDVERALVAILVFLHVTSLTPLKIL